MKDKELATSRELGSEGYIEARKYPDGKYQLFFRGTCNEVFPGKFFSSVNEARQYWRVMKAKAVEAEMLSVSVKLT